MEALACNEERNQACYNLKARPSTLFSIMPISSFLGQSECSWSLLPKASQNAGGAICVQEHPCSFRAGRYSSASTEGSDNYSNRSSSPIIIVLQLHLARLIRKADAFGAKETSAPRQADPSSTWSCLNAFTSRIQPESPTPLGRHDLKVQQQRK